MKLLLDFSQIIISDAQAYYSRTKKNVDMDLLRHIVLKNISFYKKKFQVNNDDVYICLDSKNYWRREIFPFYKQNRKKIFSQKDVFNWDQFFIHFNKMKEELKTELPYRIIEVDRCEADDVIAAICLYMRSFDEVVVIVSSDKDLLQIQNPFFNSQVKQWSPYHKKFLTLENKEYDLFEHVVKGDKGDGIPNILSDDDVFITSKRSKAITQKNLIEWKNKGNLSEPELFCPKKEMFDRFYRNKKLIDLTLIPEQYTTEIIQTFKECKTPKVNTFNYLVKHRLTKIMETGDL